MRLLPLALGVLWPAIAIAGPSEEELVATIVHTPRFPEAENAVRMLIRDLHDERRIDEIRAWVFRLVDDPVITFRRPELAQMLREIQIRFLRDDASELDQEARRTAEPADFERCADAYRVVRLFLQRAPELTDGYWRSGQLDDARYYEAVCAEHAGHPLHAIALYGEVSESPRFGLAQSRLVRLLGALPQIGYARAVGAPMATIERPRRTFQYDFPDEAID